MNYSILRKKLLYRSWNRGWKETDILLGKFCAKHIDDFTELQLEMLDRLLNESDADIYEWATKKLAVPDQHNNIIMTMLQNSIPLSL